MTMKWILIIVVIMASCTNSLPEKDTETRSEEKQDGITVTVDTATTKYEFDIKM